MEDTHIPIYLGRANLNAWAGELKCVPDISMAEGPCELVTYKRLGVDTADSKQILRNSDPNNI